MTLLIKPKLLEHPKTKSRLLILVSTATFFAVVLNYLPYQQAYPEPEIVLKKANEKVFDQINITAESAIVYDINNGEAIYSKNPNEQLPLASVTKIMSAIVVAESGNFESPVLVTNEDVKLGSNAGVRAGDKWRLKDLLDFSLVTSSNGGIRAVASTINSLQTKTDPSFEFISEMNNTAQKIGLKNTYFINETGLDIANEEYGGSFSTARDVALMLAYTLKNYPDLLSATTLPTIQKNSISGKNTNDIVTQIPGLLASKTGYTLTAGGNLAIIFDAGLNKPMAVVVLSSSQESRFSDMKALVDATIKREALSR